MRESKVKAPFSILAGFFLIFVCITVVGVGFQRLAGFFDPPGIVITFGITAGYLLLAFGFDDLLRSIRIAFTGRARSEAQVLVAVEVCRCGAYAFVISGILGTLIGLINMLAAGMDDPSVLTSGMAIALITVLYGVFCAGLCYVLEGRCRAVLAIGFYNSHEASDKLERVKRPLLLFFTGMFVCFVLFAMAVLIGTMVDSYGKVSVDASFNNKTSGRVVFVTEPLYGEKPEAVNRWCKPAVDAKQATFVNGRVYLNQKLSGIRFETIDLDSGKKNALVVRSNDEKIENQNWFEIELDDNGLRILSPKQPEDVTIETEGNQD